MSNLSKIRRDKMIEFLETLKEQHSDDESLIAINQIEKELVSKRYGLVWEEHEEAVDVMMRDNIPVFTEVKEREISMVEGEEYNFLLEGDNLHSLHLLEKTHKGKVDVIYIDPPYNTGNKDFVYNDRIIESEDLFRHSKWLSFMYNRLQSARKLLSDTGVILISIDDNEQAQLKLLCDEIFGNDNFLGTIIQNKMNAKNDTTDIQKNHEYILVYRKKTILINNTKVKPTLIRNEKVLRQAYKEGEKYYYINDAITTRGEGGTLNARPNLGYTVYYNPETGDKIAVQDYNVDLAKVSNDADEIYTHDKDLLAKGYIAIVPPMVRGKLGCWTWSIDKFNNQKDSIIITGKAPKFSVKKRTFVNEQYIEELDGKLFYSSYEQMNSKSIIEFSTNEGTTVLNEVMGKSAIFNNPKNLEMIIYLLSLIPKKDALVMDFFAGSGTTAHAVMELNKRDNGKRRFITCTNNEMGICENVTYKRIKNTAYNLGKENNKATNVKYYRTDFVSKTEEYLADLLLGHVTEMIQLEHGIKLDNKSYIMIMNDEEADELEQNWSKYTDIKAIYVAQDVLLTASQEALFATVHVHIIPDYYFNFELREAGELW